MELLKYDGVVELTDNNKVFKMFYREGHNLYWNIWVKNKEISYWDNDPIINFEIKKEDYELYKSFDELFENVKTCNLFSEEDEGLKFSNEYKYLYHNNMIMWHSDDREYKNSNSVMIIKEEDKYIINFYLKEADKLDTSVKFNISDSRYGAFGLLFVNQFNKLSELEVEEEIGYQKKLKK